MIARMRWSSVRPGRLTVRSLGVLGLGGSLMMAMSSSRVGAVPLYFQHERGAVEADISGGCAASQARVLRGLRCTRCCVGQHRATGARRWFHRLAGAATNRTSLVGPDGRSDSARQSRSVGVCRASQLVLHDLNPYNLGPAALPGASRLK